MKFKTNLLFISAVLAIAGTMIPAGASGGRELMNVWHIPVNEEPAGVTMRNPFQPLEGYDSVFIYCGGYPIGTIWSGSLYWQKEGDAEWSSSDFVWDTNWGNNEYFYAVIDNSVFEAGDEILYYLAMEGDPGTYDPTYVYGSDDESNATTDEQTAQDNAFTYIVGDYVTPTPAPPPPLMNVWHIPSNEEPPSVTMRNPLHPEEGMENVYIYCGGNPIGTIWSGTLYFRAVGSGVWNEAAFDFDSNNDSNEYWAAVLLNESYTGGDTVEYYLEMNGNPEYYSTTYVYGDDDSSVVTDDAEEARDNAFEYTLPEEITPTPFPTVGPDTPTYTPTRTPTAATVTPTPTSAMLNVWHIPTNEEPPTVNMRNPLYPSESDSIVYVYCGGHPHGLIWGGTLYYKASTEQSWHSAALAWDSEPNENEYFLGELENAYSEDDVIQYYLAVEGNPGVYETTYLYGDDTSSTRTLNENTAREAPYSFTLGGGPSTPTVSPTGPTRTPTRTPTPTHTGDVPTKTPTRTPTSPPQYSPTPAQELGVRLEMPAHFFEPQDECRLTAYTENPDNTLNDVLLFVFLDIGTGDYWFWPGWVHSDTGISFLNIDVLPGSTPYAVLNSFSWPSGTGYADGFLFWGAITDEGITQIIGQFDTWEFGFNG